MTGKKRRRKKVDGKKMSQNVRVAADLQFETKW